MKNNLCRVSNTPLIEIINFGFQPLGNGFIDQGDTAKNEFFYPMTIGFSEVSKMFQLMEQPSPEKMFHDHYAFYSSSSKFMEIHFKKFAEELINSEYLKQKDPFIVELGCNDGIMLKNFSKKGFRHLGIEPSLNVAKEANNEGVRTISEFFSESLAKKIVFDNGQADIFFAANVMCHIPNILSVVRGIKELIKPTGIVIFEDPYLGDVISKTSYDQIYDEHVFLFSALSVKYLFGLYDMEIIDVQHQKTHGGSMRYTLAHRDAHQVKDSVKNLFSKELSQGLDKLETFYKFRENVEKSREDLLTLLKKLKLEGKKLAGYAATSKSTTILNYCGIGPHLIDYICDTTPIKHNKLSPGMHIPIVPHEFFINNPPDYAILLAWNHTEEIMQKEKKYISGGGKWITHVPEVKVFE